MADLLLNRESMRTSLEARLVEALLPPEPHRPHVQALVHDVAEVLGSDELLQALTEATERAATRNAAWGLLEQRR